MLWENHGISDAEFDELPVRKVELYMLAHDAILNSQPEMKTPGPQMMGPPSAAT